MSEEVEIIQNKRPKRAAIYINISDSNSKHMDSQNLEVKTPSFIRRTITIAPAVNDAILRLRIELMRLHPDKEIDYTTVANALMAYGTVFLEKYARDEEDDQKALELVGDQSSLSEYGLGDVIDTMRRAKEELEKEETFKVSSNSVKEKQRVGTPKA